MRHSRTIVLWAAISSIAATTAFAQHEGTTNKLEIYLVPAPCKRVDDVVAVMLGKEGKAKSAKKVAGDPCHWKLETDPEWFRTNLTHFSLRLVGQARSRCKVPMWRDDMAQIEFDVLGPVEQITITPDPSSMSLPYAREVHGEGEYVDCTETGALPGGLDPDARWNVRDVDLTNETLRLRDFESQKDVCGLLVNALPAIKKARKKKGAPIPLNRPTLVDALSRQRAGKDRCQSPNLSSPAIDITEKKLNERGLTTISVTVK